MECPKIHDECKECEAYSNGKCLLEEEFNFLRCFLEDHAYEAEDGDGEGDYEKRPVNE